MSKSRKSNARRGNSEGGNAGNGPGHNSSARADTIREVCQRVTSWEAEAKAIRAKITAEKQKRIKGDLGMKISDFGVALRLHQLEGDDRDLLLDTIHETFKALGVHEQLDWVTASQRAGQAATEAVNEAAEAAAVAGGPVSEKAQAAA